MKNKMLLKKILSLVLVLSILTTIVCSVGVSAKEYKNTKFIYCNECNTGEWDPINMDFSFDFDMIANGDNQTYSKDLAIVCAMFSTAAYAASDPEKADMAGANAMIDGCSYSNTDPIGFGKTLGFEDSYFYDLYSNQCFKDGDLDVEVPTYSVDTDDTTAYYFGHKKVGDTEVIMMSIRGTNGTQGEWSSNFDIGSDTENYYKMMGYDHPDWTNKENHKGADVAKTRVLKAYNSYAENYLDKDAKKAILITGHSRGAGIANLLGKEFEDNDEYKSFTYTFAGLNATASKNLSDYKTIWNIVNKDDVVPLLPTTGMGFGKYGTTIERCISEDKTVSGESLEKYLEKLCGWYDYNNNTFTDNVVKAFDSLCPTRESMYDIDYSWQAQATRLCTDEGASELIQDLKDYGLYRYCEVEEYEGTVWGTNLVIHPAPAYTAQVIANLAAYGASYLTSRTCVVISEFSKDKTLACMTFVHCYVGGMSDPHLMSSYYAIVKEAI